MTVTFSQIVQRVAQLWDNEAFVDSVCSAVGSTTSLVDAIALKSSYRGSVYEGWWIYRPDVSSLTVYDSFSRADDATSLGSGEIGASWTVDQGTGGILGGQAYFPTQANYDRAHVVAAKDGRVSCTISGLMLAFSNYSVPLLTFRGSDANTFLQLTSLDAGVSLDKYASGTRTPLAHGVQIMWPGVNYNYSVDLNGNTITAYVDGRPLLTYVLSGGDSTAYNAVGSTWVGMALFANGSPTVTAKWDNFLFAPTTGGIWTDRQRQVATDTASTGTLVPDVAWSTNGAPAAGERYQLMSLPISQIERAINTALERMETVAEVSITPVAQQIQYTLSDLGIDGWLVDESQYLGVWRQNGTTAAQHGRPLPVSQAELTQNAGAWTLNLYGSTYSTTDTLLLRAKRTYASYGKLINAVDTVGLPNTPEAVDWAAWEAICCLLDSGVSRWLSPETTPARPPSRAEAQAQRDKHRLRFPIEERRRTIWTGRPWGSSGRTW